MSNEGFTEVYFKENCKKDQKTFYELIIRADKRKKRIPLLLEINDLWSTLTKLSEVKRIKGKDYIFNFNLLSRIVAGAALISIKYPHK